MLVMAVMIRSRTDGEDCSGDEMQVTCAPTLITSGTTG